MLPVSLAFGAYDVMTAPEGHKVETAAKTSGGLIGGWAGAEAGAAMGAAIGSVVPGLGTAIGGLLGAAIGGVAGSIIGNKVAESAVNALSSKLSPSQQAAIQREFSNKDKYPSLGWMPQLDTSKYSSRQAAASVNAQKTYNDSSIHTYNIQAPSPDEAAHRITDLNNLRNKTFWHG